MISMKIQAQIDIKKGYYSPAQPSRITVKIRREIFGLRDAKEVIDFRLNIPQRNSIFINYISSMKPFLIAKSSDVSRDKKTK